MRAHFTIPVAFVMLVAVPPARADDLARDGLPTVAAGWSIELVARAPEVLYPTAIAAAPDGTLYVGSDPMDMTGPPTEPIDRVLAIKNGKSSIFAEKLWCVMGLEWIDGTLFVVHAPYLSALRDTDGDGKADERIDLMTGLGPKLPGAQRAERPHRSRNPFRNGWISLHRRRRQGNPARRGQRRPRSPARWRRSHPDQA